MLIMRLKPLAHAEHVLNMISTSQICFDGISNSQPKFSCLGTSKARFQNRTFVIKQKTLRKDEVSLILKKAMAKNTVVEAKVNKVGFFL
jgi:hypothetical protein